MTPLVKRLLLGFLALAVVVVGGASGYYVIGDGEWPLFDCFYMTIITVTTVGYGETLSHMDQLPNARMWTIGLLLFGSGTIVYFASTITAFIVEGDLKNVLFTSRLRKRIKRMKDHVVVCGAGSTGRHVIEELLKTSVPVIAIDRDEGVLRELAERHPKAEFSYVVGDATDDDVLDTMNLVGARGLVAALSGDKDNLYLVVSARQANPTFRVVARCAELSHVEKLRRAGADAVVSPNHIGGIRLVSEMVRPATVKFLDDMLRDRRAAYRIEDVKLGDAIKAGTTLREARIRERFGMTVIASRADDNAAWTYNPAPDERLGPGMTLVVIGAPDQLASMRAEVG